MSIRREAIGKLLGSNKKAIAINTILIANAFIWYSYAFNFLLSAITSLKLTDQLLPIVTLHFTGLFLALVIGELVSHKIKNQFNFFLLWILAGVFLSLVPLMAGFQLNYMVIIVFSVVSGVNFGFGIPICLSYFASTTEATNRGKLGGVIFLISGIGSFLISSIGTDSLLTSSIVLAIWRALAIIALMFFKTSESPIDLVPKQKTSYRNVLSNRLFLLYFIPWLMFLFINSLSIPINQLKFDAPLVHFSSNFENVLAGVSAVFFGFLADSKGRKRLAVAGFALLGLGYGILGFSNGSMLGWWMYTCIRRVTWAP